MSVDVFLSVFAGVSRWKGGTALGLGLLLVTSGLSPRCGSGLPVVSPIASYHFLLQKGLGEEVLLWVELRVGLGQREGRGGTERILPKRWGAIVSK